ncbi:MAG: glycerate kinase, partial [Bacteroides sp.]|nr:glycerate kinase [Bacteroides sp.]
MKIVIACDSFKGSLSSQEAGEAVAEGVRDAIPDVETIIIPIADGGEGTVDAVIHSTHCIIQNCAVTDPLARQIYADYAICGTTAIIEMAKASGLTLLAPAERNPMHATTYGTGLLIADALRRGCRDLMIGIGGSATNDGGTGMLRALGYRFIDTEGKEITDNIADLVNLKAIDDHNILPELKETRFTVACDVSNPLTG